MSTWVKDLLTEWRQRLVARPQPDRARSTGEPADGPTGALDLLRLHVERSGVELRLAEGQTQPARGTSPAIQPLRTDPPPAAPDDEADADGDEVRFGKRRRVSHAADIVPRPRQLARDLRPERAATDQAAAGPVPTKRWQESSSPADTRRAADAFRAAAYGEVEVLRADMARLKETLADILVENRELKRLIELQSQGRVANGNAGSSPDESARTSRAER